MYEDWNTSANYREATLIETMELMPEKDLEEYTKEDENILLKPWQTDLIIAQENGENIQFKQNRDVDFTDINDWGNGNIKWFFNEYPHFGEDRYRIKPCGEKQ